MIYAGIVFFEMGSTDQTGFLLRFKVYFMGTVLFDGNFGNLFVVMQSAPRGYGKGEHP